MSTFNNVIYTVETLNRDLANDLRSGKKNLDILIKKLVDINDEGKIELSNIAKDLSNKIVYIYDNLVTCINEQRSENVRRALHSPRERRSENGKCALLRHRSGGCVAKTVLQAIVDSYSGACSVACSNEWCVDMV